MANETNIILVLEIYNLVSCLKRGKYLEGLSYFCAGHELLDERMCALLQAIQNERQWTGGISQVQQFLQQQNAVRPTVGLV